MTDHIALIPLAATMVVLIACLVAVAAGYLACHQHASWAKVITRAATAFAAALSLIAALSVALHTIAH